MKDPDKIRELANRIDHEELWRLPLKDRDLLTAEQRDRLEAAIHLRRYADDRFTVLEQLKEGAEFIRGYKFTCADDFSTDRRGCGTNEWHRAINQFSDAQRKAGKPWARMMYLAKDIANEVPRMILLLERERLGNNPTAYKMCGHDPRPATPLPDNHLRCHLGVECRKCEYHAAIDANQRMTPEARDEAKAWTCATHVLLNMTEDNCYIEGILHDKSDAEFDRQIVTSLSEYDHG